MSSDSDDCSDQDYNPEKDNSEAGSEIESDDDIEDEDEPTRGKQESAAASKRKATTSGRHSKRAKSDNKNSDHEEDDDGDAVGYGGDEESEKKRADALWADFLGGDAAAEEPKEERRRPQAATSTKAEVKKDASLSVAEIRKKEPVVVKEIFEYAGEQVVVEKVVTEPPTGQTSKSGLPKGRSVAGGGLGSVLGALNKKNKISTLDKTKLDWDRFKKQEGISEDLSTFNRGKDGYLERQDFLQRTDVRQFDIEREIRQTTRSNR